MRIAISVKLRPFSHLPGVRCLIPFSTWEVQVFPAKLSFQNLAGVEKEEISLPIKGPVKGFTIIQNLEKGRIEVFGRGKEGFFRYYISASALEFIKGETLPLAFIQKVEIAPNPLRLSLGVHKKQDWELVSRRCAMQEVLPFWLRLSQIIPEGKIPRNKIGTYTLLDEKINKQNAIEHFQNLFQAGFVGILSPRVLDENHLGIIEEVHSSASPLGILFIGAHQILRLFFFEEKNRFYLLPELPKEFHAGRLIRIQTTMGDEINLEWSKKQIKKVIIRPKSSRSVQLKLQRGIRNYRLRKHLRQKGEVYMSDQELELVSGQTLYLDRFTR